MKKYDFRPIIGLFIMFSILFYIAFAMPVNSNTGNNYEKKYLNEMERVYKLLQEHPYENRNEITKKMVEAAIKAMASEIDSHTKILTTDKTKQSQSFFKTGSFGGIGAILSQKTGWRIENINNPDELDSDTDLSKITKKDLDSISGLEELLLKLGDKIRIINIYNSKGEMIDKNMPLAMYEGDQETTLFISIRANNKDYTLSAFKHFEYAHIVKPIAGGPAEIAGIKPDDKILGIKKTPKGKFQSFKNKSVDYVVRKLRGPIGTEIIIRLKRNNEILEIPIQRKSIKLSLMEVNRFDNIDYIKFDNFTMESAEEFKLKLVEIPDSKGLMIDLRKNSGGLLRETMEIINYFIAPNKKVLSLNYKDSKDTFVSTKKSLLYQKPIVIYVDKSSASASEILAGILKYHKKAIVVGEKTYGKGTVQQISLVLDFRELYHTIAEYFIIGNDGREHKINGIGIEPDIKIDPKTSAEEVLKHPEVVKYLNK